MIDQRQILNAIVTLARTGTDPVGYLTAPPPPVPDTYTVIEVLPGVRDGGLSCPEADMTVTVRVRGVARASNLEAAGQAADTARHRVTALLLDRTNDLAGTSWTVTSRSSLGLGGIDGEGNVANSTEDLRFLVAASEDAS